MAHPSLSKILKPGQGQKDTLTSCFLEEIEERLRQLPPIRIDTDLRESTRPSHCEVRGPRLGSFITGCRQGKTHRSFLVFFRTNAERVTSVWKFSGISSSSLTTTENSVSRKLTTSRIPSESKIPFSSRPVSLPTPAFLASGNFSVRKAYSLSSVEITVACTITSSSILIFSVSL